MYKSLSEYKTQISNEMEREFVRYFPTKIETYKFDLIFLEILEEDISMNSLNILSEYFKNKCGLVRWLRRRFDFIDTNKINFNYNFKEIKINPLEITPEIKKKFDNSKIEKIRKTTLQRYGTEYYTQTEEYKEKSKQTSLERYGTESPNQSEIVKNKQRKAFLDNYGVDNYSKTQEFKDRMREINENKDHSESVEKYRNTCLERYGVDNYSKTEEFKETYRETMMNNYGVDNYSKTQEFKDFLVEHFNENKRNFSVHSKPEKYLFENIQTENKVVGNRKLIGKELDIFLPSINLGIEYNGLIWHSSGKSEHKRFNKTTDNLKHYQKMLKCESKGIQLFNIFEHEDLDLWLSMINTKLNINKKIYARKCKIKELKSQETKEFLDYNHIQGYISSKVNLGLYFEDELVSVMTFSKPRFNKNYEYELIRFCSKRNTSVIGGASKLWKYFVTKYNPNSVITYANRRFSNGEIYSKLGFELIGKTEPNYFYFKPSKKKNFEKIYNYKSIKDLNFDKNISIDENMYNNEYRKMFDCGNLVFSYKNDK